MYEGMCFSAFYKLHLHLTVSSTAERVLSCLESLVCGVFSLQNALLSTNVGCTGRLHYFPPFPPLLELSPTNQNVSKGIPSGKDQQEPLKNVVNFLSQIFCNFSL